MIAKHTIDLVRERTDIVALVRESVKLERRGKSFVGLCPFHREKSPSFHVSPDKGFFYCFGCKEHGTAYDFVVKLEGLTFPEAVRRLAQRAGVTIEDDVQGAERREAEAARRVTEELYQVNQLAALWFESMLREHPLSSFAKAELDKRGLSYAPGEATGPIADALQAFRIGYAPASWDGLSLHLRKQGISPVAAEKLGLIAPRKSGQGHYDWFRHRLMFAILDTQGRVVGFSGRILPDPETGLVDKTTGKYVNSPESPVYKKGETVFGLYQARQAVRAADQAIVVEGNFDVVALHARGVMNVVAPLGTAFTVAQAKLIRRYAPSIVLLFDGDAAGRKATREARETCRVAGLSAKVARLPDGRDPDDYSREKGREGIDGLVRGAVGILEHLVDDALGAGFASSSSEERAARVKLLADLLASEDDPTVRALAKSYADRIVQKLEVPGIASLRDLQTSIERTLDARLARSDAEAGPSRDEARRGWNARPEDVALALACAVAEHPPLFREEATIEAIALVEGDVALTLGALRGAYDATGALDPSEVLERLPEAHRALVARALTAPAHERIEDARDAVARNAAKLRKLMLAREREHVDERSAAARRASDTSAEDEILRDIQRRAAEKGAAGRRGR